MYLFNLVGNMKRYLPRSKNTLEEMFNFTCNGSILSKKVNLEVHSSNMAQNAVYRALSAKQSLSYEKLEQPFCSKIKSLL